MLSFLRVAVLMVSLHCSKTVIKITFKEASRHVRGVNFGSVAASCTLREEVVTHRVGMALEKYQCAGNSNIELQNLRGRGSKGGDRSFQR